MHKHEFMFMYTYELFSKLLANHHFLFLCTYLNNFKIILKMRNS